MIYTILHWSWWIWFLIGYTVGTICMGIFFNTSLRNAELNELRLHSIVDELREEIRDNQEKTML
jgi:hypothetical protein